MAELLLLADGNNLAHRSRHTQADKRGQGGQPSGVVYGNVSLLRQLLLRFNPAGVLVAFDGGRHEKTRIDPNYKGHRGPHVLPKAPALSPLGKVPRFLRAQRQPKVPRVVGPRQTFPSQQAPLAEPDDRFPEQVDDLYVLMRAAGLPTVRLKGFEADSVIGAVVQLTEAKGVPIIIVSADHDFHQLVTERVRVYDDVKKAMWDIEAVTQHYQLVVPREVSVYKALAGDASDHVKGVVGCGPVMALKAIEVLRRELGQAPYVHRLSDPPDQRTRRVVAALEASGLEKVAAQVPALVRSYQLVDIPRAGQAILEPVRRRCAPTKADAAVVQALVARYGLLLLGDWLTQVCARRWPLTAWLEAVEEA
jgi:5'-3' exonuclease